MNVPTNTGTFFDALDKQAAITLSNDDKTATASSGSANHVRAVHGKGTGKWRFQVTIDDLPGAEIGLGISGPYFNRGTYLGVDRHGINYVYDNRVVYNSTTYGSGPGAYTTGDVIDVYVDATARKVWFAKNGTVSGDPTAGTGGFNLHASFVGSIFPHAYIAINGGEVTMETEGGWAYPGSHPSYLPWSAEQEASKTNARGFLVVSRGPNIWYGHTIAEIGLLATTGGSNLLAGGTATSAGGSGQSNVIDGNTATFWEHSPGGGMNQVPSYIEAHIASPVSVEFFMIRARAGSIGEELQAPTLSDLYISADDINFDKVLIGYDWGAWTPGTPGEYKELAIPSF